MKPLVEIKTGGTVEGFRVYGSKTLSMYPQLVYPWILGPKDPEQELYLMASGSKSKGSDPEGTKPEAPKA